MRTLEGYDLIPYESFAITQTHPDALATLGRLLGIASAHPERCRVLELGAASGGNLIPMAWHLPGSRFVGIDLSAEQVRRGQALSEALGLTNLSLLHQDILAVDETQAPFDFILVHGVYSWVPEVVKEHILHLCGCLLSAHGIAYISYNTLPGWRQRGMVRDMLLYHCRGLTTPAERLSQARELIELLIQGLHDDPRPETEPLRRELAYLSQARASYLYHEYLEETNTPELFSDFMARARRHGLAFLAEARLHTMLASTLGPAAETALARLAAGAERDQYLDFLRLRTFRQTLLVRGEEQPCWEIDLERLGDFALYADLRPLQPVDWNRPKAADYVTPSGEPLKVEHPLTKAALERLTRIYPNALPLGELLRTAADRLIETGGSAHVAGQDECLAELFNLYVSEGIGLTLCTTRWPNQVGTRPRASALARAQAAAGEGHLASVRHRALGLDPLAARLLLLLDGRRDHDALLADLVTEIRADPDLTAALGPAQSGHDWKSLVAANLERLLDIFARAGLLVADEMASASLASDV